MRGLPACRILPLETDKRRIAVRGGQREQEERVVFG